MKMKDGCFAMLFVAVAMACSSYAVAQAAKHEPDFTLTISTDDQTVVSQKDMEVSVNVEEGNISNHPINAGRPNEPGTWYKMIVLRDGSPAPMTERYRKLVTPEKEAFEARRAECLCSGSTGRRLRCRGGPWLGKFGSGSFHRRPRW